MFGKRSLSFYGSSDCKFKFFLVMILKIDPGINRDSISYMGIYRKKQLAKQSGFLKKNYPRNRVGSECARRVTLNSYIRKF